MHQFLSSRVGQKLKRVIFVWITKQAMLTVDQGAEKASYNVGYSAGFRDGIAALDTLVTNGLLTDADNENEYD